MPFRKGQIGVSGGVVSNADKSTLVPGELTIAKGCEYRLGTREIHKQPGRSVATSAGLAGEILNLHNLEYTEGSDVVAAVTDDGDLFEAPTSTALTFGAAIIATLSSTAIPQFTYFADRWVMCNGSDINYIREPEAIPIPSGHPNAPWATGNWRPLGMIAPDHVVALTTTGDVEITNRFGTTDLGSTAEYSPLANTADADIASFAEASIVGVDSTGAGVAGQDRVVILGMTDTSLNAVTGRSITVYHTSLASFGSSVHWGNHITTEISVNSGSTWTQVGFIGAPFFIQTLVIPVPDSPATISGNVLRIRFTLVTQAGNGLSSGHWLAHRIYDIYCNNGAGEGHTTENDVYYGLTEIYDDSQGLEHESNLGATTAISPSEFNDITGVAVSLPGSGGIVNTFTTHIGIYRSLDEEGGGYPTMYRIAKVPYDATVYDDTFQLSLTSAADKDPQSLLDSLTIIYPDGRQLVVEPNAPPPVAKVSLLFQGSMCYVPAEVVLSNKLFYSISTSQSALGGEQVPEFYFLEFTTPRNDAIQTLALTNGGRSLVVFFDSYAMLVNYLPQATDPGVFDTRVKEYVSDKRGAAGRLCACTWSPDEGVSTLCAAVDDLGLWITDGVGMLKNWSKDLAWDGVSNDDVPVNLPGNEDAILGTSILTDNPPMRRLELIYDATGNDDWYELHFFYGELKENGQPKITGPHPAGYRCKHYTQISGKWQGFSGDATVEGHIFLERATQVDASHGYDLQGGVHFDVESGEQTPFGLDDGAYVRCLHPKFKVGVTNKEIDVTATFGKTGNTGSYPIVKTKVFNTATDKKITWLRFADFFRMRVRDTTNTTLAPLVGFEYDARDMRGEGGDS